MSGARFARTGRCRFFAGFCALIVMIGMVAIFHSSQQELDEVRHSVLQCEQNMEALKKRWQITMEQKLEIEKVQKEEQNEHLSSTRNLEQRLKEQNDQHAKEQMDSRIKLEKIQQTYKLLQNDHELLVNECAKSKKQQLDDANSLEKKLQSLRSELQKAKNLQENEIALWKEKYDGAAKENSRLEALLNVADAAGEQNQKMRMLQDALAEYGAHCEYKPKSLGPDLMQQQINNPLSPPETTHNTKLVPIQMPSFDKPKSEKFFKEQRSILPKPLEKVSNEQETQLKQQPEIDGDQKVVPLGAPRKLTSTQSTKSTKLEQRVLEADSHKNKNKSSTSSSSLPPLPMPPNQRRPIPDMVAPIPELDQLLKNDASAIAHDKEAQIPQPRTAAKNVLNADVGGIADIDAALEDTQRQENDDGTNNRYANVVNDMEAKSAQKKQVKISAPVENDSGAHEIKDQDLANEPSFNLPVEDDDNNFFEGGEKHRAVEKPDGGIGIQGNKHKDDLGNEDDDFGVGRAGAGAGDIAVKNQHLFEGENLNNEVVGDQGKEFPDGLRIEDANDEMNEDEDEDEYANLAARQQGVQAIRN